MEVSCAAALFVQLQTGGAAWGTILTIAICSSASLSFSLVSMTSWSTCRSIESPAAGRHETLACWIVKVQGLRGIRVFLKKTLLCLFNQAKFDALTEVLVPVFVT
eukprot:1152084-Pelagomonas_calceolata.AAC.9